MQKNNCVSILLSMLCCQIALLGQPYAQEPIGKDILLIINYNHPYYASVNFIKELYGAQFPNMVFYGPNVPNNYKNVVEECNHHEGWYGYKAIALAMQKYPNYAGYFLVNDDCIMNFWNYSRFDISKIWAMDCGSLKLIKNQPKAFNWPWWYRPCGYAAIQRVYSELLPEHRSILAKNANAQNMVYIGMSDIYYIPSKYREKAIQLCSLMEKHNAFLEIAVPTMLTCLDDKNTWELLRGKYVWDWENNGRKNAFEHYSENLDFFHPIKFSDIKNREFVTKVFSKYSIPYNQQ